MIRRTATVLDVAILVATLVAVSVILVVGRETPPPVPPLAVGDPSPQTFTASRSTDPIADEAATERKRQEARASVPTQYREDPATTQQIFDNLNGFFRALSENAFDAEAASQLPVEEPTTTNAPPADGGTDTGGGETTTSTTVAPTTTTTTLPRRPLEEQVSLLADEAGVLGLSSEALQAFVALYNSDLDRVAEGQPSLFPEIVDRTYALVENEVTEGIKPGELNDLRRKYLDPVTRPPIFIAGLSEDEQEQARLAISELVARTLAANLVEDPDATERLREEAAAQVETVTTIFNFGDTIAKVGEPLDAIQIEAIAQLGLYQPERGGPDPLAIVLLGMLAVLLAAFFLWRIAPAQWSQPRHFALLGILLVLAAAISRIPEFFAGSDPTLGYLVPAVVVGFIAAILFDPRTAVLLAVPMAVFTAVSTGELAYTLYAGIATVVPVGFVSSVSSRRQLRLAVLGTAAATAPMAYALEWLFDEAGRPALEAAGWAFVSALATGFLALGIVSFLEAAFGVTTTLTLLDLLDRNHPALRLLEEKAPGTFNHSILVGQLAGRAARAVGADPLLAQAAAWYHDLGKTENPQYFVENQFGVSNPHDSLPPEVSAEIIRRHVPDGLKLARRYHIPNEVADGIRTHHGTSLMRYFYHRALELDPNVDPDLFRHHGVKPRRKEMAIVMLSDAIEGAARAYAQEQDPTAEGLKRIVDTVVQEKLDDGQLDESQLTFGDLTRVKEELVRALTGYYHARVPYPGFPGPRVESPS